MRESSNEKDLKKREGGREGGGKVLSNRKIGEV